MAWQVTVLNLAHYRSLPLLGQHAHHCGLVLVLGEVVEGAGDQEEEHGHVRLAEERPQRQADKPKGPQSQDVTQATELRHGWKN